MMASTISSYSSIEECEIIKVGKTDSDKDFNYLMSEMFGDRPDYRTFRCETHDTEWHSAQSEHSECPTARLKKDGIEE